jgi:hypothetical protein
LETLNHRGGAVDDDRLFDATEDVVNEKREAAIVIEVRVANDDVTDSELLLERQRAREPAGIERNVVVEKETRQESTLDASPGTTQDTKLHDYGCGASPTKSGATTLAAIARMGESVQLWSFLGIGQPGS